MNTGTGTIDISLAGPEAPHSPVLFESPVRRSPFAPAHGGPSLREVG